MMTHTHTHMADLSAEKCLESHERGDFFTLEHPARSSALHLENWQRLMSQPGVQVINYTTCMSEGSRRRKCQVLITNHPAFRSMEFFCSNRNLCDRTHDRHLKWRPTTSGGKVVQFCTGDERKYPEGFCRAYARAACSILQEQDCFVGPHAPLSGAVCAERGQELPGYKVNSTKGVKTEL